MRTDRAFEPSGEGTCGETGGWKPGAAEFAVPRFHAKPLLCFAGGIPTQCYIICSQLFANTALFCVTLGQTWVKCNWSWMIPFLPELARHKNKLKNKEEKKNADIFFYACFICIILAVICAFTFVFL